MIIVIFFLLDTKKNVTCTHRVHGSICGTHKKRVHRSICVTYTRNTHLHTPKKCTTHTSSRPVLKVGVREKVNMKNSNHHVFPLLSDGKIFTIWKTGAIQSF